MCWSKINLSEGQRRKTGTDRICRFDRHNFCVTLNGKTLGTILDNLDLKMENIVFDNAVIIAYEEKYLPLLAAMAVMVARELARDRS